MAVLAALPLRAADGPLSGRDIAEAIVAALAREGRPAAPLIAHEKLFYRCDVPLSVTPMFGSWDTVEVRCTAPANWRLAVRAQGGKTFEGPEVIAPRAAPQAVALARPARRGEVLLAADLVMLPVNEAEMPGSFGEIAQVVGRTLSQTLPAETIIRSRHLAERWAIQEDDVVEVRVTRGGVSVSGVGVALERGQIGEFIRVMNPASGAILRARVIGEKNVEALGKIPR